eukprot:TRINITY_DN15964_c0_g1_i1.p1 TRINITY_DN15964_c0_g1~~TRINITY_DN15964_c0_g1_i1.p1  ORF type:complete len:201 (+),score=70.76 TRINITY_DN15964_c0_g1_i1:80-604(+)
MGARGRPRLLPLLAAALMAAGSGAMRAQFTPNGDLPEGGFSKRKRDELARRRGERPEYERYLDDGGGSSTLPVEPGTLCLGIAILWLVVVNLPQGGAQQGGLVQNLRAAAAGLLGAVWGALQGAAAAVAGYFAAARGTGGGAARAAPAAAGQGIFAQQQQREEEMRRARLARFG